VYLNSLTDSCPDPLIKSEVATRRTVNGGEETFYCVPPNEDDELNVQGSSWCTQSLLEHSAVDECGADSDDFCAGDPCLNDECTTQHGQIVTLCGKDEAFVDTPDEFEKSVAKAQGKIITAAGDYHHPNVPGNLNADPNDPLEPPPGSDRVHR
jgi:hypothetical protein